MANSPQEVLVECRQHDVKAVALHVTDLLGKWHQLTIPVARLTEESFEDGFPWTLNRLADKRGEVTDVLLLPQPTTAYIEPHAELPTLCLLCTMHDPLTREELPEDPRTIALKAEKYARESGIADIASFALMVEFFLFDSHPLQRRWRGNFRASEHDDSNVAGLEQERSARSMHSRRLDDDFRTDVMHSLADCGVEVAAHRQSGSDRFKSYLEISDASLVASADNLMVTKHVVKRLAARCGKSATFMPLPQAGRQPAGMSTQLALLKHENCALSGAGYAGLSELGLHAIGGLLRHTPALTALTNSTTNSYTRLGAIPGGLPKIAYSQSDLLAAVRVPSHRSGRNKCLEMRLPDAASNPYLAFAAILMAVVDGVQNKLHPGPALDPNPYGSSDQLSTSYPRVPSSFEVAVNALEEDGEFLLRGDVFTPEVLEAWILHKRMVDIHALRVGPHPQEVVAYYDV